MTRIVVSYRRADTAAITGRIVDRLIARYGRGAVFLDVDHIPVGADFRAHIRQTLSAAHVLIAVVGARWRGAGGDGTARIDNPDDPVRVEIETAQELGIAIVPVLAEGAIMPTAAELPPAIRPFHALNAAPVEAGRDFHHDMDHVIEAVDAVLRAKGVAVKPLPHAGGTPSAERLLAILRIPLLWIVAGGIALPLAAGFALLSPPWPRSAVAVTAIVNIVAIVLFQQALRPASLRTTRRFMVAGAVAVAVTACAYLLISSLYTYQTPANREHLAKGFVCTPEALAVFKEKCPNLGIDELRTAEYEAERLWTGQSITIVRVSLLAAWLLAFVAMAAVAGGFLSYRERAAREGTAAAVGVKT